MLTLDLKNSSSKGFLTFAQNNKYTDYIRLAYVQAMSIKLTQTENQYAVVVPPGTIMPDKYKEVFDHVIDIPWGDLAEHEEWKLSNEWKAIYATPFDQTLKLDCDMLFFDDLKGLWDQYAVHDFVPAVNVNTYRGETVTGDFYRRIFTANGLPNIYSALFYFRKTDRTYEFFRIAESFFKNWKSVVANLKEVGQESSPSTDVVYAYAAMCMGLNGTPDIGRFVHMKKEIQNVPTHEITETWYEHFTHYFDRDMRLHVEGFPQRVPFHYHVKEFITDELVTRYERALGL